jgi:hypothetical protein
LHVIRLAQFTIAYTRGWAANSVNARVRLKADSDRALQDNALLREEKRIKDVRMARIPPHQRPLYPPTGRMAILEVKAARGLVAGTGGQGVPGHRSHDRVVDGPRR